MLKKIIKVTGIKQFKHEGGSSAEFSQLNLIYGRNGAGKSTFCKILNFINDGDVNSINLLSSLEKEMPIDLTLLFDDSNNQKLKINLKNLSDLPNRFQVYNQTFIDSNVHTSSGVNSSNLTNYYDFCLGCIFSCIAIT